MKDHTTSSRFEEKEADRLIASYGKKPSDEKKEELKNLLRAEKGKYLTREHQREKSRSV